MDRERFLQACDKIVSQGRQSNGIGTLGEKSTHAVLKEYFEPYGDNHEIKIGGFVADICGENGIIEIQSRGLGALNRKLDAFLEACCVTVVHPIVTRKTLVSIDKHTGEILSQRKSPKCATIYSALPELYRIKFTLDNPRMKLCLCLIEADEYIIVDQNARYKRRSRSKGDKIPTRLVDEIYFENPYDYLRFLPDGLPDEFTSAKLADCAKISAELARILLNILTYLEVVERVGKVGNSFIYTAKKLF